MSQYQFTVQRPIMSTTRWIQHAPVKHQQQSLGGRGEPKSFGPGQAVVAGAGLCEIWDPVGWYQDHGQHLMPATAALCFVDSMENKTDAVSIRSCFMTVILSSKFLEWISMSELHQKGICLFQNQFGYFFSFLTNSIALLFIVQHLLAAVVAKKLFICP